MSGDIQKFSDETEDADDYPFGCPRCGSDRILEISTTLVSYPVTAWWEDGSPAAFGEPEYGEGEEFECRREDPAHCTFDNPARLPLEEDNDDDAS